MFLAQSIQNFQQQQQQQQSLLYNNNFTKNSMLNIVSEENKSTPAPSVPTQNIENLLMKGLSDTEMVAIMMPDVKISTPGLQQIKIKAKKVQRGQKGSK